MADAAAASSPPGVDAYTHVYLLQNKQRPKAVPARLRPVLREHGEIRKLGVTYERQVAEVVAELHQKWRDSVCKHKKPLTRSQRGGGNSGTRAVRSESLKGVRVLDMVELSLEYKEELIAEVLWKKKNQDQLKAQVIEYLYYHGVQPHSELPEGPLQTQFIEAFTIPMDDPREGLRGHKGLRATTQIEPWTVLGVYQSYAMPREMCHNLWGKMVEFLRQQGKRMDANLARKADGTEDKYMAYEYWSELDEYATDYKFGDHAVSFTAMGHGNETCLMNDPNDIRDLKTYNHGAGNVSVTFFFVQGYPIPFVHTLDAYIEDRDEILFTYGDEYWRSVSRMHLETMRKERDHHAQRQAANNMNGSDSSAGSAGGASDDEAEVNPPIRRPRPNNPAPAHERPSCSHFSSRPSKMRRTSSYDSLNYSGSEAAAHSPCPSPHSHRPGLQHADSNVVAPSAPVGRALLQRGGSSSIATVPVGQEAVQRGGSSSIPTVPVGQEAVQRGGGSSVPTIPVEQEAVQRGGSSSVPTVPVQPGTQTGPGGAGAPGLPFSAPGAANQTAMRPQGGAPVLGASGVNPRLQALVADHAYHVVNELTVKLLGAGAAVSAAGLIRPPTVQPFVPGPLGMGHQAAAMHAISPNVVAAQHAAPAQATVQPVSATQVAGVNGGIQGVVGPGAVPASAQPATGPGAFPGNGAGGQPTAVVPPAPTAAPTAAPAAAPPAAPPPVYVSPLYHPEDPKFADPLQEYHMTKLKDHIARAILQYDQGICLGKVQVPHQLLEFHNKPANKKIRIGEGPGKIINMMTDKTSLLSQLARTFYPHVFTVAGETLKKLKIWLQDAIKPKVKAMVAGETAAGDVGNRQGNWGQGGSNRPWQPHNAAVSRPETNLSHGAEGSGSMSAGSVPVAPRATSSSHHVQSHTSEPVRVPPQEDTKQSSLMPAGRRGAPDGGMEQRHPDDAGGNAVGNPENAGRGTFADLEVQERKPSIGPGAGGSSAAAQPQNAGQTAPASLQNGGASIAVGLQEQNRTLLLSRPANGIVGPAGPQTGGGRTAAGVQEQMREAPTIGVTGADGSNARAGLQECKQNGPRPNMQTAPARPHPHRQDAPAGPLAHRQEAFAGPHPHRQEAPAGPLAHRQEAITGSRPHKQETPTGSHPDRRNAFAGQIKRESAEGVHLQQRNPPPYPPPSEPTTITDASPPQQCIPSSSHRWPSSGRGDRNTGGHAADRNHYRQNHHHASSHDMQRTHSQQAHHQNRQVLHPTLDKNAWPAVHVKEEPGEMHSGHPQHYAGQISTGHRPAASGPGHAQQPTQPFSHDAQGTPWGCMSRGGHRSQSGVHQVDRRYNVPQGPSSRLPPQGSARLTPWHANRMQINKEDRSLPQRMPPHPPPANRSPRSHSSLRKLPSPRSGCFPPEMTHVPDQQPHARAGATIDVKAEREDAPLHADHPPWPSPHPDMHQYSDDRPQATGTSYGGWWDDDLNTGLDRDDD